LIEILHCLEHLLNSNGSGSNEMFQNINTLSTVVQPDTVKKGILLTKYFMGQVIRVLMHYKKNRRRVDGAKVRLHQTLGKLTPEIKGARLPLGRIRDGYNDGLPDTLKLPQDNQMLAKMFRSLDLQTVRGKGGLAHLVWEQDKIDKIVKSDLTLVTLVT
jgi:hypothetical protein